MLLRDVALEQLTDEVVRRVYSELEPENCGLRNKELSGKSVNECADLLFDRIERLRNSIAPLNRESWVKDFSERCEKLEQTIREDWEVNWRMRCNSKRLFKDIQSRLKLKTSVSFIKAEMMKEMRFAKSEDWRVMESLLAHSVAP